MKIKGIKLEWYAIKWNINRSQIEELNVLYGFEEKIAKVIKKKEVENREDLKYWLKRELMYHFWSKAEWEIAIGGLHSKYPEEFKKVDVWQQLEPNLDRITDYVIKEMEIWKTK